MKVLWVTAQQLPYVAKELNIKPNGFGGWVMNMMNELKTRPNYTLAVAMSGNTSKMIKKEAEGITCYVASDPGGKNISVEDRDKIIKDFNPDIIHIEGNEFPIHNTFSKVKNVPVLLSLQGILSGYEPYQYGELPIADYMFDSKNKLSAWILYFRKRFRFNNRVAIETETISNVKYITGRTIWDKAHAYRINNHAKYFHCSRILRPEFYQKQWKYDECEKHSIFIGNGYSPLKGLHFALEAVGILKKDYPDIKIRVAGTSPIEKKKNLKYYGYSRYIKKLIHDLGIQDNVEFLGSVPGDEMAEMMRCSNVFLLPSLIENSPNTLGEAMLMGVPSVSAYVGGVSDMAVDGLECLFYRANDPSFCAYRLKEIFDSKDLSIKLSVNGKKHALITHNPKKNCDDLIIAYETIVSEECSHV